MNEADRTYFGTLMDELSQRAARSYVSKLGPVNNALRAHLQDRFEKAPGDAGSFLSDPVFEASFGWEQHSKSMLELKGEILNPSLIQAMDSPQDDLAEQRFDSSWAPYSHQVTAWKALGKETPQSLIVSSGTGSGKTECFLVPILNDLANQLDRKKTLIGVQALLLYPLNALINSQRDRLQAWTYDFDGKIRYCLYNGDTPDQVPAATQRLNKTEVLSRRLLRETPPPILVTNATMLEYMLVRQQDTPILEKSKGQLRWIVLDEAHTYIGSHAAEISLLLRRVLHAFGVKAKDVRFVATSATIGGGSDDKSKSLLQQYLADLAGVDISRVTVIHGKRTVPGLPKELIGRSDPLPPIELLRTGPSENLYNVFAGNDGVRRLRQSLTKDGPRTLSELANSFFGKESCSIKDKRHVLNILDICRVAKHKEDPFLPLRIHIFHRTQSGLWACSNNQCSGRNASRLDSAEWPFGKLFMGRRETCDEASCQSKVFEVVFCENCGADYLATEEIIERGQSFLKQMNFDSDDDQLDEDFLLDDIPQEVDKDEWTSGKFPRLITGKSLVEVPTFFEPLTGCIVSESEKSRLIGLVYPENGLKCLKCGQREKLTGEVFRPARSSAAFHLLMSTPTLLEHTSEMPKDSANLPFGGRRLITFSDSRQGTARFSLQAQLDAERNYVRSWLYHQVAASKPGIEPAIVAEKERELDELKTVFKSNPIDALKTIVSQKESELSELVSGKPARLGWTEAAQLLKDTMEIHNWLPEHWRHTSLSELTPYDIAKMCLIREFARRPKRQVSLETLGFLSLQYPALEKVSEASVPAAWRQMGADLKEWQTFLKIALDFVVRGNCAVRIPLEHSRWIGSKLPRNFLVDPDADLPNKWNVRWPLYRGGKIISKLPTLLMRGFGLSCDDRTDRAVVNEFLQAAWTQIRSSVLSREQDGYRLDLERQVEFELLQEGWICPITRRVLDTTFKGWSPYLTLNLPENMAKCTKVTMPGLAYPFGRTTDNKVVERKDSLRWLDQDENITDLREKGVWTAYSDRLALFSHFYRINEHSAQQDSKRLRNLEKDFKSARINILSCSTTMEMGVDIGGVSSVAMNNAPPSPANYLQRAGRAGRRKETAAVSFTLCQSVPHGEQVFSNPTWPFRTSVYLPQVSLQSERIVQRHINALVLTRFLQLHAQDLTKLQCGWFFLPPEGCEASPSQTMSLWASNYDARAQDEWLIQGINSLVGRTTLLGVEPSRLLETVGLVLKRVADRWSEEEKALAHELLLAGGMPGSTETRTTPAQAAISKQLRRIREEYLLGELASQGFLPGYGFPTSVVSFINTTLDDLKKNRPDKKSREDNWRQRSGYPTRDLPLAIRDYAPGTDIVVDGQVYTSEGVTLNWHIPAGDYTSVPEVQSFRTAWRCRVCGASGTRSSRNQTCTVCRSQEIVLRPYLEPAGFAVNIYDKPHNDLSYRKYIPINKPWISAGQTPWAPLPRPELGRYRFSQHGQIFHQSGGLASHGYAICLRCGRSASETGNGEEIPQQLNQHLKLRGGKEANGETLCPGNEQDWAIKRNQWLGVAVSTDVFELQLFNPSDGAPIGNDIVVYSLAVALRQALAEELGITDREISCASIPSRTHAGQKTFSIVLYDTSSGGAGFVAAAAAALPKLLTRAREILNCNKQCDSACHSCLLTYDTQYEIERLNRHEALACLTNQLLDGLSLPSDLYYFGKDSRLEFDSLSIALLRELQHVDIDNLRIYLGGETRDWDVPAWPLRQALLKYASEGRQVTLFIAKDLIGRIDSALANPLASLIEAGDITIRTFEGEYADPDVPGLIAEVGGAQRSIRWASTSKESLCPSEGWGRAEENDRCVRIRCKTPLLDPAGTEISSGILRKTPRGTYRELIVKDQLTGSVDMLGKRFWALMTEQVAALGARLNSEEPITKVIYRDRYLASPLNVKLLIETLKGLVTLCGGFKPEVKVLIETIDSVRTSHRLPELIRDDWTLRRHRNEVIVAMINGLGGTCELIESPRYRAQHVRELIIEWEDGATWTARLDHGLGFLRSKSMINFDFNAEPLQQWQALSKLNFPIKNSMDQGSHFYLTDVQI